MRTHKLINSVERFFKDKDGKWAVFQFPNTLLFVWVGLTVLLWVLGSGVIVEVMRLIQTIVLVAWASIELIDGDSNFRRVLGATVLIFIVFGNFF